MKELKCPSGATLKIGVAPFEDSKALYKAFLKEARTIPLAAKMEWANVFKELYCIGFSSDEVEKCLQKCMERSTYSGHRITMDLFEDAKAREDYTFVCFEVAKENLLPFTKSLYAELQRLMEMKESAPA